MRYYHTSIFKYVSFILLVLMFGGCLSIKTATTKSGKKYFETFYVGEEGIQYFIKPVLFKDEKSNEDLILDISFRYRDEVNDSAIVNFSIKNSIIHKTIDSLILSNNDFTIKSDKVELLFNEKNKTGFTSRFSTKFSLNEIMEMFTNNVWKVNIWHQNKISTFKPHRKTLKIINTVRDKVFVLM